MANKNNKKNTQKKDINTAKSTKERQEGYCFSLAYAQGIDEPIHIAQMLPCIVFSAVAILIVRMASYTRPMDKFFWSSGETDLTDFFSYYKMELILICAALALLIIAYRLVTQSLAIKKTLIYIPMAVYSAFVIISYIASNYKEFSLLGYNDRFEGTLVLLAYMVMLFLIVNSINTEKNVKMMLYPMFASATLLGLLGISQALDRDFFRTNLGQKLISPNYETESGATIDQLIDEATAQGESFFNFTFQNKEIYQTVYNINYVSFYLTLLIPIIGLLFIWLFTGKKEGRLWKSAATAIMFALLLYNLIGSASSGGFLGMGFVVLIAVILFNKKLINWWKPIAIMIAITVIVGAVTAERWLPEINSTVANLSAAPAETTTIGGSQAAQAAETTAAAETQTTLTGKIDYIDTTEKGVIVSIEGTEILAAMDFNTESLRITDEAERPVPTTMVDEASAQYSIGLPAFEGVIFQPASDEEGGLYIIMKTNNPKQYDWIFLITPEGALYRTDLANLIDLDKVPAIGWSDNPNFGSGRGLIWSRSIPMMGETFLLGHGADTYCLFYPHDDYVGKYNAGWNINMIVDKPHNMYMGMWIGTGGISCLALIAIMVLYAIQSIKLYFSNTPKSFLEFSGIGCFLGVAGFAITGIVDDSSVSVMPMFYGILGTGIAINMILTGDRQKELLYEKN